MRAIPGAGAGWRHAVWRRGVGMANTTPAAAIVNVLTGSDAQEVVGIGANLPLAKVGNKVEVVRRAIAVNRPDPHDGLDVLAKVGGFDLLGDDGCDAGRGLLRSAGGARWLPLPRRGAGGVPDNPQVKPYLIPSHYSAEGGAYRAGAPGAGAVSQHGDARLGEGSGAACWRCRSWKRPARCITKWGCWRRNIVLPKG